MTCPHVRAVKIAQAGSVISDDGAVPAELVRRVLARFPDLNEPSRPTEQGIADLLRQLEYEVTLGSNGRLFIRSSTQLSSSRGSRWAAVPDASRSLQVEAVARAHQRLAEARQARRLHRTQGAGAGRGPDLRLHRLDGWRDRG